MKTRLYFTSVFLIAVCAAWLYPFICILKYGKYLAHEPVILMLIAEILMFAVLIIFAISNLVILLRSR